MLSVPVSLVDIIVIPELATDILSRSGRTRVWEKEDNSTAADMSTEYDALIEREDNSSIEVGDDWGEGGYASD